MREAVVAEEKSLSVSSKRVYEYQMKKYINGNKEAIKLIKIK